MRSVSSAAWKELHDTASRCAPAGAGGKGAELGEALKGLIEPTRAEPGNISYELLASLDDERDYTFVEEYQDGDALEAHMNTPHVQAAMAAMPDLVEGGLDLRTYRLIG